MIEKQILLEIENIKLYLINKKEIGKFNSAGLGSYSYDEELINFISLITDNDKYKDIYVSNMKKTFQQDGLACLSFDECITYFHWLCTAERMAPGTIKTQIEKGRFEIVINLLKNYLSDMVWKNNSKIFSGVMGFIVGDAMGVPTEFAMREKLFANPVTEMIGYGSHPVPAGSWSDDTSMTLALIDSINNKKQIDYDDIMKNFVDWVELGKYTPEDKVFDIGRTCLRAIRKYSTGTNPIEAGLSDINSNGNGSLMRILPLAYYLYYKNITDDKEIINLVNNISSLTHAHDISKLGCYIYVKYVLYLLNGYDKKLAYKKIQEIEYSSYAQDVIDVYRRILNEDISEYNIDEINSSGYIVDTLEASIWMLLNTKSYSEAIIGSINLGNDTDTIGAICGSMAGLIYGLNSIPEKWLNALLKKDYLFQMLNDFETTLCNSKKDAIVGAMIGDIVGSRFEHNNCKSKDFTFFRSGCRATDDTVMTLAIAKTLTETNGKYKDLNSIAINNMVEVGRKYQQCGFGRTFFDWIKTDNHEPYNSYGNGSAMRISPVGIVAKTEKELKEVSQKVTEVSHNHPDGIKGAEAVAMMIFLIRKGLTKEELKERFIKDYYPIDFNVKELQENYKFKISCSETVPQAFVAFYESINFEDAIRNAISIGGDSDTIGAICGSIAAEYYGIPNYIYDKVFEYLDVYQIDIYNKFKERFTSE